jgi:hypothetical protein
MTPSVEELHLRAVHRDMRARCIRPGHKSFGSYGWRGITVCSQWRSFAQFRKDMGPRPPGTMLDRIDNNKGYEPANCKWSGRDEQNRNRRNIIRAQVNGQTMTLKEACRALGRKYSGVHKRVAYLGWDVQAALAVSPVPAKRRKPSCA